jgi:hypothetical protein
MAMQLILYDRAYHTKESSRDWLLRHGYKTYEVYITGKILQMETIRSFRFYALQDDKFW